MIIVGGQAGESGDMSCHQSRAGRLVEAMLSFGLLEEDCTRSNRKPLRATQLLHDVMVAHNTKLLLLIKYGIDGGPQKADLIKRGD